MSSNRPLPPIRVLVFAHIERGLEAEFEAAFADVSAALRGTPGRTSAELIRESTGTDVLPGQEPGPPDGTTRYVLVAEWESREAYFAWVDDPRHRDSTAPMHPYWSGRIERRIYDIAVRCEG